ncbi:MAG: CTP synthetase, partial [Planctomycetes bacterium]|nr:CTP synthetase [Planctomycetota bacterium]
MRLGAYPCRVLPDTRCADIYGRDLVLERHRHRWEYNNDYREQLEKAGLTSAGVYESVGLVEVVELSDRPFHLGVQYHPEYKSKPLAAHPLFQEFVGAAIAHMGEASPNTTTESIEA